LTTLTHASAAAVAPPAAAPAPPPATPAPTAALVSGTAVRPLGTAVAAPVDRAVARFGDAGFIRELASPRSVAAETVTACRTVGTVIRAGFLATRRGRSHSVGAEPAGDRDGIPSATPAAATAALPGARPAAALLLAPRACGPIHRRPLTTGATATLGRGT
jgi:hypothetical protein